jgi:Flp pilus assembly protein TadG
MTRQRLNLSSERGVALVYMAMFLTTLLISTGLAVDTGRAYVVKAQLSKAVDGAALGAARMLNSGDPRGEATRIFNANFPLGYLGTLAAPDPTAAANFFDLSTDPATGVNIVTVTATAKLPTTFMKLANFDDVTVSSTSQATRRMVDLSLVMDVSSSIGWRWPAVRDAARAFVTAFDAANDRISFITFGNGAKVIDAMPAGHGFNKAGVVADIPNALPGGSTNMVEGLYRGWDELKAVAPGTQSGLRVIVLFTDGASNSVPGDYPAALTVDGAAQSARRGLRNWNAGAGRFPAEAFNINNAARNLVEIIANAARSDAGDYPIRIYTIGMGELVRYNLGTIPEKSEDILMRMANDSRSPDFNKDQLEGKYYFAKTQDDVSAAFGALQSQIVRLSK